MSRALRATLGCIFIALFSAGCGSNADPNGAPAHADAWLSFKYNNNAPGCGTYTQCPGLASTTASPGNTEAASYYKAIGAEDPTGPALTLSQWETNFGMPATQMAAQTNGPGYAHAVYGNKLDLQLGRDMYCWQAAAAIVAPNTVAPVTACYVSNYGEPPIPISGASPNPLWPNLPQAIECAVNAVTQGLEGSCSINSPSTPQPFATVAMVYSSAGIGTNKDPVTFYVFDQNGVLAPGAALDGEGAKTVPRMCMACHGGTYDTGKHRVFAASNGFTASFLPFDTQSFLYSSDTGYDPTAQQDAFRQLNNLVASTNPATAISDLITGLYSGNVAIPGSTVSANTFVPTSWSVNPTLYTGVFRRYCRMCHLAQDPPADFSSFSEFQSLAGGISGLVCQNSVSGSHDMPHAEIPFGGLAGSTNFSNSQVGFWWDPTAIADLNSFLQNTPFQTTPCAQP